MKQYKKKNKTLSLTNSNQKKLACQKTTTTVEADKSTTNSRIVEYKHPEENK